MTGATAGQSQVVVMTDRDDSDEQDFDRWYADHVEVVWRYARRRVTSTEDADEVTAETFTVAWRRRGQVPRGAPHEVRLWLLGVARNVLANLHRAERRRLRVFLRLAGQTPASVPGVDETADPGLWKALSQLSLDDRDVLLMRAWDELGVIDIATLLGTTPSAVSARLHRARGRLHQALADDRSPVDQGETPGTGRRLP